MEKIKQAAKADEWYKRGGIFAEAYNEILAFKPAEKKPAKPKKKGTKK